MSMNEFDDGMIQCPHCTATLHWNPAVKRWVHPVKSYCYKPVAVPPPLPMFSAQRRRSTRKKGK